MEKKKVKIRFNIVDLLILLAIALVVVGVAYKLFNQQVSQAVSPKVKLEAVALLRSTPQFQIDAAEAITLPTVMVAGNSVISDAAITEIWTEPSIQRVETADGTVKYVEDAERFNIYFRMEASLPQDNAVYKIGAQEVRVGKIFVVKTKTIEVSTTITEMTITEQ